MTRHSMKLGKILSCVNPVKRRCFQTTTPLEPNKTLLFTIGNLIFTQSDRLAEIYCLLSSHSGTHLNNYPAHILLISQLSSTGTFCAPSRDTTLHSIKAPMTQARSILFFLSINCGRKLYELHVLQFSESQSRFPGLLTASTQPQILSPIISHRKSPARAVLQFYKVSVLCNKSFKVEQ